MQFIEFNSIIKLTEVTFRTIKFITDIQSTALIHSNKLNMNTEFKIRFVTKAEEALPSFISTVTSSFSGPQKNP